MFPSGVRIRAAAHTDLGQRQNNEDAFLADAAMGLCAVADGMGGHAAGEVASRLAVEMLVHAVAGAPDAAFLEDPSLANRQRLLGWLFQTIAAINGALHARAQAEPALAGMGSTLDVALVRGQSLFLAHVGDSRAYVLRGDALYGLTDDHTLSRALRARGSTPAEAAAHPQGHMLVRALGVYPDVHPDVAFYDLAPGDVFLLCTDGLHGALPTERIREILLTQPAAAAEALVGAARAAGARDNVTAVVFRVEQGTFTQPPIIGSEIARATMAHTRLFADFTLGEMLRVQRVAVARELLPGATLFTQGEVPSGVFLVLSGRLSVWVDGQPVGFIEGNDTCGEYALADEPSVSTLRADTPTRLLQFPQADLKALMASDPALASKFGFAAMARFVGRVRGLATSLARYRGRDRRGE